MNIKEISGLIDGDEVEINAVVQSVEFKISAKQKPYLQLVLQDRSGIIEFPVWDDFDSLSDFLFTGVFVKVRGKKSTFNGEAQISFPSFRALKDANINDFIPSYEISQELFDYFENLVNSLSDKYKTIVCKATGALGTDEKRWKAFITCPSAEKKHGNKLGGLFVHTMGLLKTLEGNIENYVKNPFYYNASEFIDRDRLLCKAILHDIKKDREYEYDLVIRRKPNLNMDHRVWGAAFIEEVNKECGNILTEDEVNDIAYSILAHHGQYGEFDPKSIEDILLHLADMTDSRIVTKMEENK